MHGRPPVDFRSKLDEIGELLREASRQWPTDDPPILERSPTGHRLILKKSLGAWALIFFFPNRFANANISGHLIG